MFSSAKLARSRFDDVAAAVHIDEARSGLELTFLRVLAPVPFRKTLRPTKVVGDDLAVIQGPMIPPVMASPGVCLAFYELMRAPFGSSRDASAPSPVEVPRVLHVVSAECRQSLEVSLAGCPSEGHEVDAGCDVGRTGRWALESEHSGGELQVDDVRSVVIVSCLIDDLCSVSW